MNILFVCTGNICRSPMAQIMLANAVPAGDVLVESAGTRALNGEPMHAHSQAVLRELRLYCPDFRSRMLTPPIVEQADLVLGFSREHRAIARQLAPGRWRRAFTIREFVLSQTEANRTSMSARCVDPTHPSLDIDDPIGKPVEAFRELSSEIGPMMTLIAGWAARERHVGLAPNEQADPS